MKVLFLTGGMGLGGAEKMSAFALKSMRHVVDEYVIACTKNSVEYDLPENTKIIELKAFSHKIKGNISKLLRIIHYIKCVRNLIKTECPDMVMAFGSYFSAIAVFASKGEKVKTIVSERRTPQNLDFIWKCISKITYKMSDMVVFQLEGARDFYHNLKAENTAVIPNPYTDSHMIIPCNNNLRRNVVALAAARLEYEKGFDVGIKAFKIFRENHPEYTLEIYGEGNFQKMYGYLVNDQDGIIYKGLSHHIIDDLWNVKAFLLPSRSEGIPNMLLEALGAGIPCVAADCLPGGPRLLIGDNNERGLLVKVDDIEGTAAAISRIVDDNALAERLSINAQMVKNIFGIDVIAKQWEDCVKKVMKI